MNQLWNDARFADAAETYGSDIARWPVELRDSAASYAANNLKARQALKAERALDTLLDSYALPRAYNEKFLATLCKAPLVSRPRSPSSNTSHVWASSIGLAASLVFGFLVGVDHTQRSYNYTDAYLNSVVFGFSNGDARE